MLEHLILVTHRLAYTLIEGLFEIIIALAESLTPLTGLPPAVVGLFMVGVVVAVVTANALERLGYCDERPAEIQAETEREAVLRTEREEQTKTRDAELAVLRQVFPEHVGQWAAPPAPPTEPPCLPGLAPTLTIRSVTLLNELAIGRRLVLGVEAGQEEVALWRWHGLTPLIRLRPLHRLRGWQHLMGFVDATTSLTLDAHYNIIEAHTSRNDRNVYSD